MSTTFGKKRHDATFAKFTKLIKAGEVWAGEDLVGLRKQANANIEGKTGTTKEGDIYTADQVKEARILLMALDVAKGAEKPVIDYTTHKGFGVIGGTRPDTIETTDPSAPIGQEPGAAAAATTTDEYNAALARVEQGSGGKKGMKKATAYNPMKELDKAISTLTPGTKKGPTRKAAKTARARSKLSKVQTPEPHSKEWAQERVAAQKEQERIDEEQRHLSWHWQGDNPPPLGPGGKVLKKFFAADGRSSGPTPDRKAMSQIAQRSSARLNKVNADLLKAGYIPGTSAVKPKPAVKGAKDLSKKRKNKNGTYSPGR